MTNTIKKPVHHSVVLGSGHYGDSLRITSIGSIDPTNAGATALSAPSTLATAFITNDGTVTGGMGNASEPAGGIGTSFASAAGSLSNAGLIEGGRGYSVVNDSRAGAGGSGLVVTGAPSIENAGTITGGAGGSARADGSYGGRGGDAVILSAGVITNSGLITGGHGGFGYGNAGGYGVGVGSGASLQNMGTVVGGAGAASGFNGGYGGDGVILADNAGASFNSGLITGGHGGLTHNDAAGGTGGVGVMLGNDTFTNTGTIIGGTGGLGYFPPGYGGDGVYLAGGTLVSSGLIKGGAGGNGGGLGHGIGGAGVYIKGGVLDDSGTVTGGDRGGDAVTFDAGASQVILEAGAKIHGDFGGWQPGDTIDVRTVQATAFSFQSDTLSLLNSGGQVVDTLDFTSGYSAGDFALQADGDGGTDVVYGKGDPAADFRHGGTQPGEAAAGHADFLSRGADGMVGYQPGLTPVLFEDVHFYFGRV